MQGGATDTTVRRVGRNNFGDGRSEAEAHARADEPAPNDGSRSTSVNLNLKKDSQGSELENAAALASAGDLPGSARAGRTRGVSMVVATEDATPIILNAKLIVCGEDTKDHIVISRLRVAGARRGGLLAHGEVCQGGRLR